MKVLRFEHAGICCAIPPGQVVRGADTPDGPTLNLFGAVEPAPETWLLARCGGGAGWIPVQHLSLDEVTELGELSPLAAAVLGHPHVVGWVEREGRWMWLVDLDRYRPEPAAG